MPIKPHLNINVYNASIAANPNFFKGTDNLLELNFDPLITGYAFILWTKLPSWVTTEFPGFKALTEKNFKAFSGLSDMELSTAAHQYGFSANEYHVAQGLQKQNTDFTLRHAEYSGSPIKNMYQLWVSGIRDPETGIATYPKVYGLDYAAKNHTGEILYIMTRPDANNTDKKNIEFAAYYTNVFPTKIPLSHLNYEIGSHEPQNLEISFKGSMHIGPKVDAFAKSKLNEVYAFRTLDEFDPTNSSAGGANLTSPSGHYKDTAQSSV
jgi:hypothetical protein